MKVTVETKKGLEKNLKVFVDKNTINKELDVKYDQLKNDVVLKGFRPGKVPKDLIKRQFGKAIYGEVIDKILKETTTKALDEKKIKPALQPKIDLKQFGEGKDLEYVISVTEMPKVKLNTLDSVKYKEYKVNLSKELILTLGISVTLITYSIFAFSKLFQINFRLERRFNFFFI